jgi:hypothetical protein
MSVNIFSSPSLYCRYMFWPDWPSSGVQVVVMKDFAVHKKVEQHYSEQQSPSSQQLVQLLMAS